ncbi:MAG: hypothetical protein FJX76_10875 [Armatimonadetes bacterium]|nr:hypothetical protein [Armatimonadota bacterium]
MGIGGLRAWASHTPPPRKSTSGKAPADSKERGEGGARRAQARSAQTEVRYYYVRPSWRVMAPKVRGGLKRRWRRLKLRLAGEKRKKEINSLLESAEAVEDAMAQCAMAELALGMQVEDEEE